MFGNEVKALVHPAADPRFGLTGNNPSKAQVLFHYSYVMSMCRNCGVETRSTCFLYYNVSLCSICYDFALKCNNGFVKN